MRLLVSRRLALMRRYQGGISFGPETDRRRPGRRVRPEPDGAARDAAHAHHAPQLPASGVGLNPRNPGVHRVQGLGGPHAAYTLARSPPARLASAALGRLPPLDNSSGWPATIISSPKRETETNGNHRRRLGSLRLSTAELTEEKVP